MIRSNKHIEIVRSTTRGLSYISEVSCNSIYNVLTKHFTNVGVTIVNNLSDLIALVADRPDLVFLGMECIPMSPGLGIADPNKIWLADFLDSHNIAYTGSARTAHELERHKNLAKQRVMEAELSTAAFCVVKQNHTLQESDVTLAFPLFVKPTNRGGGLGIRSDSVVYNFDQLRKKVKTITSELKTDALIEEYLSGREFSVAILKDNYSADYATMPIELVAPPDRAGVRLLSSQVKSSNAEQVLEVVDEVLKSKVTALALAAFHAISARDYGRIDIRLDAAGAPQFLEANLMPSLISDYGSFPKACMLNIDLKYEPMIMRITSLGLTRSMNQIESALEPMQITGNVWLLVKEHQLRQ